MAGRRFGFRPPSLPADMTQSGDIQLNQMSTKLKKPIFARIVFLDEVTVSGHERNSRGPEHDKSLSSRQAFYG